MTKDRERHSGSHVVQPNELSHEIVQDASVNPFRVVTLTGKLIGWFSIGHGIKDGLRVTLTSRLIGSCHA
jgi:hypothetical protein